MSDTAIEGVNLEGQYVILEEAVLKAEYRDITWRVFKANGGFGCSPTTIGSAVFGHFVRDGEKARFERYQVERLATFEEVQAARDA